MTPPVAYLLTFFICPQSVHIEAMCGPATNAYGPYVTLEDCMDKAMGYLAEQERARTGKEYWWICRPVGMGVQR
jgi:hypothetical protein